MKYLCTKYGEGKRTGMLSVNTIRMGKNKSQINSIESLSNTFHRLLNSLSQQ
jgi:hypothetical protein